MTIHFSKACLCALPAGGVWSDFRPDFCRPEGTSGPALVLPTTTTEGASIPSDSLEEIAHADVYVSI